MTLEPMPHVVEHSPIIQLSQTQFTAKNGHVIKSQPYYLAYVYILLVNESVKVEENNKLPGVEFGVVVSAATKIRFIVDVNYKYTSTT